jgi:nuclear pore complex protein Nup107
MQGRPNASLLLQDIKQEAADYSTLDGSRRFGSARRGESVDGGSGSHAAFSSARQAAKQTFESVKMEDGVDVSCEGGTNLTTFVSLHDSAIQG